MSRIQQCFSVASKAGRSVLIPYIAAGDANPQETISLMQTLVSAGADIIELGVPFSDPIADGKVIQAAYERALAHDVTLLDVLDMVKVFRRDNQETPIVLMGYQNPIEMMGVEAFAYSAAEAGVDGILTVDLPVEEASNSLKALQAQQLDSIFLLSPTTPEARIQKICASASGFIYYVSLKGVTGASHLDFHSVEEHVARVKKHTHLPIAVGFGIQNAQEAATISQIASAVVVGSVLVKIVGEDMDFNQRKQKVFDKLSSMRVAMDEKRAG
ncbi:MAG: tryptophan synthase subunit alpha [Candidatus Oxydemutatoraceae bacterium WSBS_2016_MAG_OTU14]